MADPKIKFKRSAVAGKIPTAAQVPLGEIALNTYDGFLYASKSIGAGTTVIAVNPFRVGLGTNNYNTFFTAGNVGIGSTLPSSKLDIVGDVKLTGVITATTFSGSGASLINLPAANLTGTLPAISGANLTNLNGSNISSGTVSAARVGNLPASKITTGTFDVARIPTLNQDTTGTAALAEGLTGSPNITVSNINVGGISTFTDKVHLLDNDVLHFGGAAGDAGDLQIYHDGSNSYVKDAGTGALHLLSGNTAIKNAAENKTSAVFNVATSVDLYHNNSKKFETTSTGAKITGDLVVTGEVIPSTSAPGVTTTTSTSQTALDTFSHSTYTSAVYNVQATSGSNVHLTTINVIHDGSDTYLTEFATLKTGSLLATYTTDISGSNLRLLATPASTNATIFSVSRTLIRTSDSDTVTTTSTSATTINQFATTNSSAIYVVQAKQGSNVHTTKIHLVHDGSTVSMTEFAIVKTGSSLASYDADISGSNVRLRTTSASSSSTTYTISRNLL